MPANSSCAARVSGSAAKTSARPRGSPVFPLVRLLQVALPPYSVRLNEENSLPVIPELKFPHSALP